MQGNKCGIEANFINILACQGAWGNTEFYTYNIINMAFSVCMLWFKIFWGIQNFQTSLILFPFVSDYGNEYFTKEKKK